MIQRKNQTHYIATLEDIESSINHNQFWEKWNTLNPKQNQELPLKDGDTWRNYFMQLPSLPITSQLANKL